MEEKQSDWEGLSAAFDAAKGVKADEPGDLTPPVAKFKVGDFAFYDFELCLVEIVARDIVVGRSAVTRIRRASGGCVSAVFQPDDLVEVTLRSSEFTRIFREFYDRMCKKHGSVIRNWPDIKRFLARTWRNYCWSDPSEDQDIPMSAACRLLNNLEVEFEEAVTQIKSAKVRGITLIP